MDDYIKRKDAIEALGEEPYVWSDTDVEIAEHAQWVSDVKAIEAVPSADVVEIKKEGEWDMFDLISSAYYGKGMYFKQDNGIVYSRHSGDYMTIDEAIREFISLIDGEAPTAIEELTDRNVGKWERHDDGIMFWWECSECHQDPWYDREELYDYCPSCGAKMEFGESEEE